MHFSAVSTPPITRVGASDSILEIYKIDILLHRSDLKNNIFFRLNENKQSMNGCTDVAVEVSTFEGIMRQSRRTSATASRPATEFFELSPQEK